MSCDLLSNFHVAQLLYNHWQRLPLLWCVVICFQIFMQLSSYTTYVWNGKPDECCDLLSNFHVAQLLYNQNGNLRLGFFVVICFQIFMQLSSYTTVFIEHHAYIGCDLLSNFHVAQLLYNRNRNHVFLCHVVICFQIFMQLSSYTTTCWWNINA